MFVYRKRRDQICEENELLRRTIGQRKEVLAKCEHDMDRAEFTITKTIEALEDVLQVTFRI